MKRRRTGFLMIGLLAGAAAALIAAPGAGAASYTTYVACSPTGFAPPSHTCQLGDEPGAFFESDVAVEYEICVTFPDSETICAEEQEAEAETLYVNQIFTDLTGSHHVVWYVEGVEVGSWTFLIEAPAPPPPPAPPPSMTEAPTPAPITAIGCFGTNRVLFAVHPRRCTVFRSGGHTRTHEIRLTKLHWSDWGARAAEASGRWRYCGRGRCAAGPLEAKATGRVKACGRFAYTRLTVHLLSPTRDRSYVLRLPAC